MNQEFEKSLIEFEKNANRKTIKDRIKSAYGRLKKVNTKKLGSKRLISKKILRKQPRGTLVLRDAQPIKSMFYTQYG